MPLSEHEQRLLDQIERALYAEDPKFASTVRQTDLRSHMRRRLWRAGIVLLLGFGLTFASVVALMPQRPVVPEGTTVRELVALGRTAHLRRFGTETAADRDAVERTLHRLELDRLADKTVKPTESALNANESHAGNLATKSCHQASRPG